MTERKTISLIPAGTEKRAALDFKSGDTVKVFQKIQEKGKTRLQAFEGLVLARKHGKEQGATFTVRKVASGVGVERIFPLYSTAVDRIEVIKRAKTRRAKLYYIREKVAKEARKKLKHVLFEKREDAGEALGADKELSETEKETVITETTDKIKE
ncbi:MAG: 50S ribosomal protein L19 [Parcubacteria group bacterium]|nr:50S ribosomal protein L19 [Parcubacteria group bacterium]